ncbi:transcription-repair coupling factor [Heyndrickxia acidiproducens]|uniref:transcription-repair coupling factor n=1 Tax=Heyndrickxia acidiproducens TaxID=1121084 RepID=UPI000377D210|nr:transcription-repair coupling factor [Heyndrickxia acidiproducens]
MDGMQNIMLEHDEIDSVVKGLSEGLREQLVSGLSGSARSLFISSIYRKLNEPAIVLTYNLLQAQKLYDDLSQFVSEKDLFLYPANELIAAELGVASPELRAQRIEVLNALLSRKNCMVIVPMAGLRKILPPIEVWKNYQLQFEVGKEIQLDQVLEKLIDMGYNRSDMVDAPGEFSLRGGILDIYPLTEEDPLRIELFDAEVDSIRTFSADDQRSKHKLKTITIGPAMEYLTGRQTLRKAAAAVQDGLTKTLAKIKDQKIKQDLAQNIGYDIEKLKSGEKPEQIFKYMAALYDKPGSLLDYAGDNGILFLDEFSRVIEIQEHLEKEEAEWLTSMVEEGRMVYDLIVSHSLSGLLAHKSLKRIYLSLFLRHIPNTSPQNIINLACKPMQTFHGQMHVLKTEVERWKKGQFTVVFAGADHKRAQKLQSVLEDYEIESAILKEGQPVIPHYIQVMTGNLNTGFELPMFKLAVITEEELFNKKTKKQARRQKLSNAERIKSYSELNVGDYVVHVNHGIGKYLGIETLVINGVHKDYLHIKYQGSDKLYVPVDQIDLVQKYVGSEGKEPKIYKLGGSEWKRVKRKVQSSIQDIADDLIKLYAERESAKGFAFSPDGDMQREFEAAFPYRETEDQLRSIQEIKHDMEKAKPMDRLLCGDVGYGKTEVAIRAAFKAIMDGKQVAMLVPTTILAQQHYETITERFQDYPITVGLLSRFRTRKEQNETIKGLKNGTIDMVIGTHRLLSKDIQYHDLGLLIVDEEQRFGVSHKEKIKKIKTNVDVLTLTATPIPRTLHMSMLGVRDLSIIETPPENRFPVQTYVMEYNNQAVREAIERELARNGQVYFLYNRIEDIERKAEQLSMLVPDARVTYAHGQMTEAQLETVILGFLEGEYDVLVTTTIIETGVDIPNVNTLIVNDADRMGLSQLYQLRGRVGRSNRVAYAYFTYRKDKVLAEASEKRLQAIKEFTELGSGFKIAMRDLAIRGAGNLLGAQQHGFIDSVGFDLYSQMLKEAIEERKGGDQEAGKLPPFEVELDIDAYIPDAYIKDGYQKIEMYKRFRGIDTIEDIDELKEEMVDRFGEYPQQVNDLFTIATMKVYAKEAMLASIKQSKQLITILMSEAGTKVVNGPMVVDIVKKYGRSAGFGMDGNQLKITLNIKNFKDNEWLSTCSDMIKELRKAFKSVEKVSVTKG